MTMLSSYGFPQLPRRKKKKGAKGSIFPHYIDYRNTTVNDGPVTGMGQGVSQGILDGDGDFDGDAGGGAPDAGGGALGEGIEATIPTETNEAPKVIDSTDDKVTPSDAIPPVEDKSKHPYQFGCAMFMFPETQAFMVRYWSEKRIPLDALHINPDIGHDGYEDEPHVTIKFGLHDMDSRKLEEVVDGFGPVDMYLGKIKKFSNNPEYDVLVTEVESPRLMELNKLVSENLEHTDTFKEYKPHAALAFVKKGWCDDLVGNDFFDGLDVCGSEITFTNKDGDESLISLEVV